ncbi:CACNA1S, partial [Symbiodinium sp. CCMP2456]
MAIASWTEIFVRDDRALVHVFLPPWLAYGLDPATSSAYMLEGLDFVRVNLSEEGVPTSALDTTSFQHRRTVMKQKLEGLAGDVSTPLRANLQAGRATIPRTTEPNLLKQAQLVVLAHAAEPGKPKAALGAYLYDAPGGGNRRFCPPPGHRRLELWTGHIAFFNGDAYIADTSNNRILKVSPGNSAAEIFFGDAYITDHCNNRSLKVSPGNSEADIFFAGKGRGSDLDQLYRPTGLTFSDGNAYIVDGGNDRAMNVSKSKAPIFGKFGRRLLCEPETFEEIALALGCVSANAESALWHLAVDYRRSSVIAAERRAKWGHKARPVKGLLAGIRTLALAFVLLFAVLYVISGFSAMTIGSHYGDTFLDDENTLVPYFRTIPDAMFTAFRCFTGECTTYAGEPIHYLLALEFGYPFMFLYVGCYMLVTMGIFNVILAVYVDITMKAAKENDAVNAEQYSRESIRVAKTTRELLKKFSAAYRLFNDLDSAKDSNSWGTRLDLGRAGVFNETEMDKIAITKELFLLIVQDSAVQKLMDELDLPPDRANLFEIIDADGSGTLQITELLHGLLKIRGDLSKSDAVASLLATRAVQQMLADFIAQSKR